MNLCKQSVIIDEKKGPNNERVDEYSSAVYLVGAVTVPHDQLAILGCRYQVSGRDRTGRKKVFAALKPGSRFNHLKI